jgi:alkaline phosphatase D
MSLITDRRTILSAAAAFGVFGAASKGRAQSDPFTLGVASGEPWPDGFVIWTRLAPQPLAPDGSGGLSGDIPVRWRVANDPDFRQIVARGETLALDRFGRSVHVEVRGLQPGRDYYYHFEAENTITATARARTAPAYGDKVSKVKAVFASCAHWERGYFSAYRHMAEEDPDVVFFLGDYIYEYSYVGDRAAQNVRSHDRATDAVDLAGYRNRYALYKTDPDLKLLHRVAPCFVTWDDHEVQNDYAGMWSQNMNPGDAEFAARRRAAYQAFYEHMPVRRRSIPAMDGSVRLYDRFKWGDLAEFTMPDERQYRSIQPCPYTDANGKVTSRRGHTAPVTCPDFSDNSRTMLGAEQEKWMTDGFSQVTAKWNIIPQQLVVANMLQKVDEKAPDSPMGYFTDGWSGFEPARQRLVDALDTSKVKNTVFFGGDLHAYLTSNINTKAGKTVAAEFVGTAVTSDPAPDSLNKASELNPHILLVDNSVRGYISADITPARVDVRYQAISDRRDKNATVRTHKKYVVEDGKAGVQIA